MSNHQRETSRALGGTDGKIHPSQSDPPAPQDSPPDVGGLAGEESAELNTPSQKTSALPAGELTFTQEATREIDAAFEAFKSGEPDAEPRLYSALKKLAQSEVWHFFGSIDEDLMQEIATNAFLRREQFRGESRFSTWVFALAKNKCRMALRRVTEERRMVSITMHEEELESGYAEGPEQSNDAYLYDFNDASLDLEKLKADLPEEQVKVVDFHLQGYSLDEMAKKTKAPLGTIRGRWRLANEKLRKKVAPTQPVEDEPEK
jgi:RNA polymerase sigma factor (sigma-70 family)